MFCFGLANEVTPQILGENSSVGDVEKVWIHLDKRMSIKFNTGKKMFGEAHPLLVLLSLILLLFYTDDTNCCQQDSPVNGIFSPSNHILCKNFLKKSV